MWRTTEAHHDTTDEQTGRLVGNAVFEIGMTSIPELLQVVFKEERELGRDCNEAR